MNDYGVSVGVYDDRRILITSSNPFRDKDLLKTLPGAKYDIKEHRWFAPLTWTTCLQLRGTFRDRLVIEDSLRQWAYREKEARVDPAMELRAAWDAQGDEDLYPFQRAGVQFLAYARRALLCDEMGTGKTVQTIRTIMELVRRGENPFPAIVVAPNNMTLTWKAEFEKWYPGLDVTVVGSNPGKKTKMGIAGRRKQLAEPAHVYIINYESVRSHSKLAPYGSIRLKPCTNCDPTLADTPANRPSSCERCKKELNHIDWKTVIVDEAHRMKNPKAKQTRACWALRTDATENVFCLTGTAIAHAPHDLWPALFLISKEEYPARTQYIDRYCLTSYNPFGPMTVIGLRPDTKDEFFLSVDPHMRRMPKEAVLPFLPRKTYTERYVEMNPKQQKAYTQMEKDMIALLDDGVTVSVNPLTQLTRLSQFASAYAEINEEGQVVMAEPSCKIDALMELLEDMGDEPLVVFAQSRQLVKLAEERLKKEGIDFGLIVGGQTPDEREYAKQQFQDGKVRVIMCTIAAGGIGITLTRAATACFLQRSWSMIDNAQAEDRVHRIGSEVHDKITIVDIIATNTLEDRQRLVLSQKEDRLEEIMRDKDTIRRLLGATN